MLPNNEHLNYIGEIINLSYEVPVYLFNVRGEINREFPGKYSDNPLIRSKENVLNKLFHPNDSKQFPVIRTTNYLESYLSISLGEGNQHLGSIVVGPIVDSRLSDEILEGLLNDLGIYHERREQVILYYKKVTILSKMKLIYLSLHLYYMLYQTILDPLTVIEKNKSVDDKFLNIDNPNVNISERRQEARLHHDFHYEKQVLRCITEGKKEEVIRNWRSNSEQGEFGILAKRSHLRNRKNLGITAITLATRAAIEGGLHHELAYTLSDQYIQNLENLTETKDVDDFIENALASFAEQVQKNRKLQYSKTINRCLSYIYNHLYEDINLSLLAEAAEVHPNYLSSLFKKEVGTSLKSYISSAKVEEAKSLLEFTDYSLLKISTLLNFHDQSYFTKTFKKYAGLTPNKFKNKFRK